MKVTREVVKDLLPLYVSGEAGPDTRALVEAFLREDPELARLAEHMRRDEAVPAVEPISRERGQEALARTKTLLRRRTWTLALALFFTGLPLSFVYGDHGLSFLLVRDAPAAASACWAAALALWVAYAWTVRRMRVTGL